MKCPGLEQCPMQCRHSHTIASLLTGRSTLQTVLWHMHLPQWHRLSWGGAETVGFDGWGQEQWVREEETVTRHLEKEALDLGTVWI